MLCVIGESLEKVLPLTHPSHGAGLCSPLCNVLLGWALLSEGCPHSALAGAEHMCSGFGQLQPFVLYFHSLVCLL